MNVLINAVSAVAGGGLTYFHALFTQLPRLSPDDRFTFVVPEALLLPEAPSNVRILQVGLPSRSIPMRVAWEGLVLPGLCRKEHADLLFCPGNIIPFWKPDIPIVTMINNVGPLHRLVMKRISHYEGRQAALRLLILRMLTLNAIRGSDLVLFPSEGARRMGLSWGIPVPSQVIHLGVEPPPPAIPPRPPGAPHEPFFLFVSNVYVYKGLEFLIEALRANPGLPPTAVLGVPYDMGFYRHLQNLLDDARLGDRFRMIGSTPYGELSGWYHHALALVYPTWCESFGLPPLEAMAQGCPSVGFRMDPFREICGETAWYAEPFDSWSLARAMQSAALKASSPHIRDLAVRRSREFTWELCIRHHAAAFRAVVNRLSPSR